MTELVMNLPKELARIVFSYIMPDMGISKDLAKNIHTYPIHQQWLVDIMDKTPHNIYRFVQLIGFSLYVYRMSYQDTTWYRVFFKHFMCNTSNNERCLIVIHTLMHKLSAEQREICIADAECLMRSGYMYNETTGKIEQIAIN